MIEPVVIRFAAEGVQQVSSAFANVSQQLRKFEENATREKERGARTRERVVRDEASKEERAKAKLLRDNERLERQKTKEAEREAARREQRAEKGFQKLRREVEQQSRAEIREAEKVTRAVEREEERKMRIRIRSSEMAGRYAARAAQEEIRAAERTRGRTLSAIGTGAGRVFGGLASLAGATMGIGGGIALASAAHGQLSDERSAALLVNSATQGGRVAAGASVGNVLGVAGQVATETGLGRGDLINATRTYVARAGADQFGNALGNMGFFAKLAVATGTDLNSITGAAGILQAQNKGLDQKGMQQMLLDLMEQGKAGAVEITDLASLAGGLGATRGLYQGGVTENQRKLLALAQVTRTEGTSAEEAMIAVKDLGSEALQKSTKREAPAWLRAAVDAKTGQIKGGPEQLIEAALLGTHGNLGQLEAVFGQRGVRAFDRLAPIFNAAGGGNAGLQAIRKEMAPIMGARGSMAGLEQQYAEVANTPAAKFQQALEGVATTLESSLEPALQDFARWLDQNKDTLTTFARGLGEAVQVLASHPFAGLGALLGASVVAEVAKAKIAERIAALFGGGGGAAGAGAGVVGKVAAVGAAGVAGAMLGKAVVDADTSADLQRRLAVPGIAATQLAARVRAGKVTPGDIAQLQAQAEAASARVKALGAGPSYTLGENVSIGLGMITGQSAAAKELVATKEREHARELDGAIRDLRKLQVALQDAAAAAKVHAGAASAVPPVVPNAPVVPIPDRHTGSR